VPHDTKPDFDPKKFVDKVDWLRVIGNGVNFLRAMNEDPNLPADQDREKERAKTMHRAIDQVVRGLVDCQAPGNCDCPLCREEKEES